MKARALAGTIAFGFTGCRDALPHMQRIATYTGEALEELEQAFPVGKRGKAKREAPKKPRLKRRG
ncbi:putative diacylglycerol O-acyltransferase [compost metagenome]